MKDTLNLQYHKDRLIILALKKYDLQKDAAKALGITTRTLQKLKSKLYDQNLLHDVSDHADIHSEQRTQTQEKQ